MKLSLPALETLAVIAYKQPVTAPEVNEIRGVDSSGVFGSLLARKLITTAGRKPVIGRPILYKTTKEFLLRFGLKDVAELPSMEEFEKMAAIELDETADDAEQGAESGPDAGPELDENASEEPEAESAAETGRNAPASEAAAELEDRQRLPPTRRNQRPRRPRLASLPQQSRQKPRLPPMTDNLESEPVMPNPDEASKPKKRRAKTESKTEPKTEPKPRKSKAKPVKPIQPADPIGDLSDGEAAAATGSPAELAAVAASEVAPSTEPAVTEEPVPPAIAEPAAGACRSRTHHRSRSGDQKTWRKRSR